MKKFFKIIVVVRDNIVGMLLLVGAILTIAILSSQAYAAEPIPVLYAVDRTGHNTIITSEDCWDGNGKVAFVGDPESDDVYLIGCALKVYGIEAISITWKDAVTDHYHSTVVWPNKSFRLIDLGFKAAERAKILTSPLDIIK
jgi:hypothetical protein